MAYIQKISEAGSLALHSAILLAGAGDDKFLPANKMAEMLGASEAHLLKVLQRMVRAAFIDSVRGPSGGYRLKRPANDISLLEIYEVFEGPITTDECLLRKKICSGPTCKLDSFLAKMSQQAKKYLAETKLADLV